MSQREISSLPGLPNAGDHVDDHQIPQEAKWLIGFWLNRGGTYPKGWRTEYSERNIDRYFFWGPRAKARIIEGLPHIHHWKIFQGTYEDAPRDTEATYFIDPPYIDKGSQYRFSDVLYPRLAMWATSLSGQIIICEQAGADWLPFVPHGSAKSMRGWSEEVVYTRKHVPIRI